MTDTTGGSEPIISTPRPPTQAVQAWSVVASNGALVFGQSGAEYAVYDQQNTYGRWPLTEEGYSYAMQTYEAHQRSLAHGIAYTATGYQNPDSLGLPTDPVMKSQTYASPMSFIGSTRRIIAWTSKLAKRSPAFAVLGWIVGITAMLFMWAFLVFWYFFIFVLFGFLTLPYRFIRRSQRKNLHVQKTALATQQAIFQQMAGQQQRGHAPPSAQAIPPSAPPTIPPPGS